MEVHIGEMTSTVEATDTRSLLQPRVLERIVAAVEERVRQDSAKQERLREERGVRGTSRRSSSRYGGRSGGGPGGGS